MKFKRILIKALVASLAVSGAFGLAKYFTAPNFISVARADDKTPAPQYNNQHALIKGNVLNAWKDGYKGQGMVIAVIDSGVGPHKDLRLSDPNEAKISKNDAENTIKKLGYGHYVNSKIPFAYNYAENNNTYSYTPDDESLHGEHVAGIAAGNGQPKNSKDQNYMRGVAPEAQILDLRVSDLFNDEFKNDVARAIYDAVNMGADVINISLGVGVPNQSSTDEEQAAVNYAYEHGVMVVAASGNSGNAASIYQPGESNGSTNTIYNPVNNGTLADPGVAENAFTTSAENSSIGEYSAMGGFSSWGPTPEYILKPDISAPGVGITSTWKNNTYNVLAGTSMASPFNAGSMALVIQSLEKTNPNLKGSALIQTAENKLMNAASPIVNYSFGTDFVSPQVEGSGAINVDGAINLNTTAADSKTGKAAVSLQSISNSTDFSLNFKNNGTTPVTYQFDNAGGYVPLTIVRQKDSDHNLYDVKLKGASISSDQDSFTVEPGKTQTVNFKLNLDNQVSPNRSVEGFLHFKANDKTQNITVPYFGYYGDLTNQKVIETLNKNKTSDFGGGYLVDENSLPLGTSDVKSLAAYLNSDPIKRSWSSVSKLVDQKLVAFSPNGDHVEDSVMPYVFAKESLANVKAEILNSNGQVIDTVDQETDTDKSLSGTAFSGNNDLSLSFSMRFNPKAFTWDGMVYDPTTGNEKVVPDGQYDYRLVTTSYNQGKDQVQNYNYPVMIDTQKPTASKVVYKNGVLSGKFADNGVGFSKISEGILKVASHEYGIRLTNKAEKSGQFTYKLNNIAKAAFKKNKATFSLTDVAGNSSTVDVSKSATNKVQPSNLSYKQPQFQWAKYNNSRDITTSSKSVVLHARVSKEAQSMDVYAKDTIVNKVYKAKVNTKDGIATFKFTMSQMAYRHLKGWAQVPGKSFGQVIKSPVKGFGLSNDPSAKAFSKFKEDLPKSMSEKQAKSLATIESGAPVLAGHTTAALTTRIAPTKGIHFNSINDNSFTILNADNSKSFYDSNNHELAINGRVDNPKTSSLIIFAKPNESDPANKVSVQSNGDFSFKVPFNSTEQRGVSYVLKTTKKVGRKIKTVSNRGMVEIFLDTVAPTLNINQNSQITTTDSQITLTGNVNDNVCGVRLYINDSNIYTQQNDAGFNVHIPGTSLNPYPAYNFQQNFDLKSGINHFTIKAVDQAGNITEKQITVNKTN